MSSSGALKSVTIYGVLSPALDLLLGPQATVVLAAALAEYGGALTALAAVNVHVQPTGAAIVRYVAAVRRADGSSVREVLVATTGDRIPPGAAVVAGEHRGEPVEVGIWRWPQDPALPALAIAADPVALGALLADTGWNPAGPLQFRVRAYRPTRRAVVEVFDGHTRWFVKVVRPAKAADLLTRHELACRQLPVPRVATSTPDGLMVLPEAAGTPLRTLILDDAELPSPVALERVLDAMPAEFMAFPQRHSQRQLVDDHADVLRCTAVTEPAVERRLADTVAAIRDIEPSAEQTIPVHGDFYEAQLLADGGQVTGVLDIDTAGPGQRADEWATLLAHLLVLEVDGVVAARPYARQVLAHAERNVDPDDLRRRIAAAMLGLAAGPFRVQQPGWPQLTAARITFAGDWLAGAA